MQSLQQFSDSQNVLGPALIRLCFPSVSVWVFFRFSSFLPKTKNMHIRLVGWVVWRLLIASGCPPHQHLVQIGWWLMEDEWRNRLVPAKLVKYIPTGKRPGPCGQCSYCRFFLGGGNPQKLLLLILLNLSRAKKNKKPNSSTWVICWLMNLWGCSTSIM